MSPDKLLTKVNNYTDNLEYFYRIGELTYKRESSYDFSIGRFVGEVAYCSEGWRDITSAGIKRHLFSLGSVRDTKGRTLYNFTLWNISVIFGIKGK